MHLVLMRHPEREKNVPEINARLTPQGLNSAQQTAVEIAAEIKSFDLLLRSDVEASKQAAEKLMGLLEIANVGVPAVLAPNRQNITLADIELEWRIAPSGILLEGGVRGDVFDSRFEAGRRHLGWIIVRPCCRGTVLQ